MNTRHTPGESDPVRHRPRLLAIAYRMLGSATDAEDAVQDAYLRLQRAEDVENPEAWLVKVTTTLCIDRLRQARQRKGYHGPWLPEPVSDRWPGAMDDQAELADSLSTAFLLMLETLTPAERAAYLLREAFGYEFEEIAGLLEKSPGNIRQIVTRARARIQQKDRRFHPSPEQVDQLANEFFTACRSGDLHRIEMLLAEDVVLYSDGGGVVHAAPRPIEGTQRVSKLLSVLFRRIAGVGRPICETVNGQPGIALDKAGRIDSVMTFSAENDRITRIFMVRNPHKLQHWSSDDQHDRFQQPN